VLNPQRKTLQPFKAATLFPVYSVLAFDLCYFSRRCRYNSQSLIAHTVKQAIKLPPLRRLIGGFVREKELVYRYMIAGYEVIKDMQAWLLPVKLWLSWNMEMLNLK